MPLWNYNSKADFDGLYRGGIEGATGHPSTRSEVKLGYVRSTGFPVAQRVAQMLHDEFGASWGFGRVIVLVGGGYAWTAEALEDLGYTDVLGIDNSNYVNGNKNSTDEAEIDAEITAVGLDPATGRGASLKSAHFDGGNRSRASRDVEDEDLSNNGSRNRVRAILGTIQTGISESVLESLSDAEAVTLSGRVHDLEPGIEVIHLVVTNEQVGPRYEPALNWKTLAQWKTLIPADTFMNFWTGEVL